MPEDIVSSMKEIAEKEVEEKPIEEKPAEEEHVWGMCSVNSMIFE